MKLAFGSVTQRIQWEPNRITYTVNTELGSSGSPCLTQNLDVGALHHYGLERQNRGVLMSALIAYWNEAEHRDRLRAAGLGHLMEGAIEERRNPRAVSSEARLREPAIQGSAGEDPRPPGAKETPARNVIGEFEVLGLIGSGGMGHVYRAWQPSTSREVALKCLRLREATARQRFENEIKALAQIHHPNVVQIYDSGREGEQLYYAMELVDGATFKAFYRELKLRVSSTAELNEDTWRTALSKASDLTRSRNTRVPGPEVTHGNQEDDNEIIDYWEIAPTEIRESQSYIRHIVEIVRQITMATQALHDRCIIHRDIKPENIMLTRDGDRAILLDLGIAKLIERDEGRLTRTKEFVGTLRYASPEQIFDAGRVDYRSDIYSLGVTLWELLTLRPIYGIRKEVNDPEAMARIRDDEPEPIRRYNRAVPRELQAIVQKCLEKKPDRRYQSVAALASDLEHYLRGELELVSAPNVGRLQRVVRRICRKPHVPALWAALALYWSFSS
jgi:serine/threonine protein kinase